MNTEITIRNVQLIRSGESPRGFISANTLLSIPLNKANKHADVKYLGARIGYINNLYYSDLCDGRVELHCDIIFTNNFIMLAEMVKNKALYPACVINTQENEAWLSEIFFAPAEDREFDEQEPINLSHLLDLVNNIAESEAPAKPQGDAPYIYAPGMNRDDITSWLTSIVSDLNTINVRKERVKSLEDRYEESKAELGEIEAFLSEIIRTSKTIRTGKNILYQGNAD
ncbi:hypothetical protein GL503_00025 [Salmonella enterica]|uniref:Uncharacterized protein n=1 Tax=Salmonella enterica I TaxID=59201 RepID=A0A3R1AWI1_SALET|nr:hypothetical protein [Salmonella enterica]EEB7405510.1 hypothetical protein [Salmonella enterica]EHP5887508.1 hypothetical protein [Salmonella enterica]EIW3134696.1 hypothetical protein [Salmonella enterica]MML55115.1 hypothetical protein [Salmonella enterica subsp. enterica serovar Kidderminster]